MSLRKWTDTFKELCFCFVQRECNQSQKKKLSTNSKSLEFTVLQSESRSCSLCQTLLNLMLCSQCWSWAMFYSRMCSTKIITLKIPFKVLPPLFILEWKSMIRLNDLNERWFRTYIGKNIRTDGSRDRWI